jgi:hypothetical protein
MATNGSPSGYKSHYGEEKGYDATAYTYDKKDSYGYGAADVYGGYDKKSSYSSYETVPYYRKKEYHTSAYDYNKKDSYSYDAQFPVTYYKPTGSYGYSQYEKPKYYGSYSSPSSY